MSARWGWGRTMKKIGLVGLALVVPAGLVAIDSGRAADAPVKSVGAVNCKAPDAPYKNYGCLDEYLGDGFFERFINYYRLEWGHPSAPADPKAPPSRRAGWPGQPQTTPPMPFTEWPYGGATSIGVSRPSAADSPLMVALGNTELGKEMSDSHVQVYGWVNPGGNLSTSSVTPGGNFPAAYAYSPNTATLDQAVVYIERVPDTVQTDHVDWGFRFSGIYGENYRYTTTYGIASYQLLGHNLTNGFDMPMMWGELYIPNIGEGLLVRLGRYISIPDIEAQLAPNNYMYSHSMTYGYDNYTNHGLIGTLAVTKNWFVEGGVSIGTDTAPWHWGEKINNPIPNPTFPDNTMLKDPGAVPSFAGGIRWQSDSGYDTIYATVDGLNPGSWGYNNLQWLGGTFYHKFNEQWHISMESYTLSQRHVLNELDPANLAVIAGNGFPSNPTNGFGFNSPNLAQCGNTYAPNCTARMYTGLFYLNYSPNPLDNISWRGEFYNDMNGQRTTVKTRYVSTGLGWQHWLSPQIEFRPEIVYYHSLDANAFNGNFNAAPNGGLVILPTRNYEYVASADMIWHF
jgi:Putative beta-barrel porin-2, OmpL-like. bbp2